MKGEGPGASAGPVHGRQGRALGTPQSNGQPEEDGSAGSEHGEGSTGGSKAAVKTAPQATSLHRGHQIRCQPTGALFCQAARAARAGTNDSR